MEYENTPTGNPVEVPVPEIRPNLPIKKEKNRFITLESDERNKMVIVNSDLITLVESESSSRSRIWFSTGQSCIVFESINKVFEKLGGL